MMSSKEPKLRFDGFSGEWERKSLEKVSTFINEKIKLSKVTLNNYISTENLLADFNGITKSSKLPNITNVTKFKINDVLISNIRPYLKKIWLADINGGASNDIIVIRTKEDSNYNFLLYIMESDKFIDYVMRGAKGVKMPRGDISLIKKYPLSLPKPKEQQKIANCLSSLDNLIEAQNKKVKALEKHKKGLMQNLFPKEADKVPKLRFDGFSGEWEEKTIGEIGDFYYGKSAPKWSLSKEAPTKCVRYGELYTKFGAMITETYSRTNIDPNTLKFSKGGEILVPRVGEKPEDFGKCCSYLPLKNIAIGEMISVFETKQNPLFYTYYFRNLWSEFSKVVEGQNVKNLYYKELEPLRIYKPTLEEQQKIANCLSSLDNLIESQNKKIESLEKHKKGLIQQLFVNSEN